MDQKEIKREIRNFKLIKAYKNLWLAVVKQYLEENFSTRCYIRKEKKSQINDLSFQLKRLEMKSKLNKLNERKEIINTREEISFCSWEQKQ